MKELVFHVLLLTLGVTIPILAIVIALCATTLVIIADELITDEIIVIINVPCRVMSEDVLIYQGTAKIFDRKFKNCNGNLVMLDRFSAYICHDIMTFISQSLELYLAKLQKNLVCVMISGHCNNI